MTDRFILNTAITLVSNSTCIATINFNYYCIEFPVTSILPSTTNFNIQTQTVNLTTSSKSQMVLHVLSTVFNNTQTRTTKSSEESASPIGPSNTPFPSITTGNNVNCTRWYVDMKQSVYFVCVKQTVLLVAS